MGLPAIGIAATIASGVMSIASGFAQAGQARAQAAAETEAARQTYALQRNATQNLEQEQAVAATAQSSTRMAQAQRELGTLQAVMAERGMSNNTFAALATDISNSESLDLTRVGENYANETASDTSRIAAAGQDLVNTETAANNRASVASTAAWMNIPGTLFRIGGDYLGKQIDLNAEQARFDKLTTAISKGAHVSPFAGQ